MKKKIYLIVGQNIDYDLKLEGMNVRDVVEYVLKHDLKHEYEIVISQSDGGRKAGWGKMVYEADENGLLSGYDSNVDSSD